jgi:hypothetical protein
MILISYINNNPELLELNNTNSNIFDIIVTTIDPNIDYYRNMSTCALNTESYLMEKSGIWTNNLTINAVIMIWEISENDLKFWQSFINDPTNTKLYKLLNNIRGDEVIFQSLSQDLTQKWIAGHPRSTVTWSSGTINFNNFEFGKNENEVELGDKNKEFFWWARKLSLKIMTLN